MANESDTDPERGEGEGGRAKRIRITLACSECRSRNYLTTRRISITDQSPIALRKFCKACSRHTVHVETK